MPSEGTSQDFDTRDFENIPDIRETAFSDGSYLVNDSDNIVDYAQFNFKAYDDIDEWRLESFSNCLLRGGGLILKDKNNTVISRLFLILIPEHPEFQEFPRRSGGPFYDGHPLLGFSLRVGLLATVSLALFKVFTLLNYIPLLAILGYHFV